MNAMNAIKTKNDLLHERVAAEIKEYILNKRMSAGDRLPAEQTMADMLGVSRTSIREAVRSLAAVGVVEVRNGKGVYVREFNFGTIADHLPYGLQFHTGDVEELVEIRRVLEVYAVEQIAENVDEKHLEPLRHAVEQMRVRAERGEDFIEEDIRFHAAIADAAERRILKLLLGGFWRLQTKIRTVNTDRKVLRIRYEEHRRILHALEQGDKQAAVRFMNEHFNRLENRLNGRRRK